MDNVIVVDKIEALENSVNAIQNAQEWQTRALSSILDTCTDFYKFKSNQHWYVTVTPSNNLVASFSTTNLVKIFTVPISGEYKIETGDYSSIYVDGDYNSFITYNSTQNVYLVQGERYKLTGRSSYGQGHCNLYGTLVIKNYDNANLSNFFNN